MVEELLRRARSQLGAEAPEEEAQDDGAAGLLDRARQQLAPTDQPAGEVTTRPTTEQLIELDRQGELFAPDGRPRHPLTPEFIQQRGRENTFSVLTPGGQANLIQSVVDPRARREASRLREQGQSTIQAAQQAAPTAPLPSINVPVSPVRIPLPFGRSLQNVDLGVKGFLENILLDPLNVIPGLGVVPATGIGRGGVTAAGRQALRGSRQTSGSVPERLPVEVQDIFTQTGQPRPPATELVEGPMRTIEQLRRAGGVIEPTGPAGEFIPTAQRIQRLISENISDSRMLRRVEAKAERAFQDLDEFSSREIEFLEDLTGKESADITFADVRQAVRGEIGRNESALVSQRRRLSERQALDAEAEASAIERGIERIGVRQPPSTFRSVVGSRQIRQLPVEEDISNLRGGLRQTLRGTKGRVPVTGAEVGGLPQMQQYATAQGGSRLWYHGGRGVEGNPARALTRGDFTQDPAEAMTFASDIASKGEKAFVYVVDESALSGKSSIIKGAPGTLEKANRRLTAPVTPAKVFDVTESSRAQAPDSMVRDLMQAETFANRASVAATRGAGASGRGLEGSSPPSAQGAIMGQAQAVGRSATPTRPSSTTSPLRQQADELFDRQISFKEDPGPLRERTARNVSELQRQVFADVYPIQKVVQYAKEAGAEVPTELDPYIMSRLHKGIRGKANVFIEQGTVGKKFWKTDPSGNTVPDYKGPGLEQVLRPVKEGNKYKDFVHYFAGLRAVELNAQGIKTGFADNLARIKVADLERANPEFKSVVKGVYRYQDEVLQYANEMGLISNEFLANLRNKYKNYAPFNRVLDGMESKGFLGRNLANVTAPIRRITGSEKVVINPLENVIKNTHAIVDAADRNQVTVLMARLVEDVPELKPLFRPKKTPTSKVATVTAKELGIDITGLDPADAEKLVDIYRPSGFVEGSNEVTAMINGEKRFFDVDPDIRKGLLALEPQDVGMLVKFLGAPARWLRAGAVLNPDFMVKNFTRDQMTAFTYSRTGFLPAVDWVKGVAQMMGKSPEYNLFRLSGGEGANLVSLDRTGLGKTAEQIASERGFRNYVKSPIEILRIFSEFTENSTRVGDFSKAIRAGQSPQTAGFGAREVTQDFSVRGASTFVRALNQIIPFFNANLGSWRRVAREFKERPMQAAVKAFMGITLPSLLLYSVNRNNPKYQELPQWQKDTFWIFPVPGSDRLLRLPKPFMLGQLFGSMPERFWEFVEKRDPELFKRGVGNAIEQGTPGFLPQAALPIVENMSNHSFFLNRPIVPRGREIAPAAMQYSGRTSEAAKALGSWVNYPPAKIDNIFRAYTGGIGTTLVDLLDEPLKAVGATPNISSPSRDLSDIPILRSFVVRDPTGSSSESVNRFYDMLEKFEKMEFAIREFQALGDQRRMNDYADKHPEAGFWANKDTRSGISSRTAQGLRKIASMMSEVRHQQRLIYNSRDLTPQQKRQAIKETNQALTDIARKALEDLPRP